MLSDEIADRSALEEKEGEKKERKQNDCQTWYHDRVPTNPGSTFFER